MKINPLLKVINPDTFLDEYLKACGVEDPERYVNVTAKDFQDPWLYPNMEQAVERLHQAIEAQEGIGILQDTDCDGVMSSAIAYDFVRRLGSKPIMFWHTGKQHGLAPSSDENILLQAQEANVTLMWVPDAGSGDIEPCRELKRNGIDTIITDHHLAKENPCAIVVNCHFDDELNSNLTGAGVTEKLVRAYCDRYGLKAPDYSDLVAFSLVSDVANMISLENRAYILKANEEM